MMQIRRGRAPIICRISYKQGQQEALVRGLALTSVDWSATMAAGGTVGQDR